MKFSVAYNLFRTPDNDWCIPKMIKEAKAWVEEQHPGAAVVFLYTDHTNRVFVFDVRKCT